jgi:hypothetical protein
MKLLSISNKAVKYTNQFIPSVNTFDITSQIMSDEFRPYQIANNAMLWADENGFFGEIEVFSPIVTEISIGLKLPKVRKEFGVPQMTFTKSINKVIVEKYLSTFTVWLSEHPVIDLEVMSDTVTFLFEKEELVGILAHSFEILDYK